MEAGWRSHRDLEVLDGGWKVAVVIGVGGHSFLRAYHLASGESARPEARDGADGERGKGVASRKAGSLERLAPAARRS